MEIKKRGDQALLPISTIQKFPAQVTFEKKAQLKRIKLKDPIHIPFILNLLLLRSFHDVTWFFFDIPRMLLGSSKMFPVFA